MTIPRSHRTRIAALKASLTRCRVYTLENGFAGQDADPQHAWAALDRYRFARLYDSGHGTYTVHVHDNCWYALAAAEPPAAEDTEQEN